ncbi:MAG: site-specific recombinase XerD [uncultured archaeon A07HR60]|nr:MAG: site-specific recombinase XerD [uncultured archaeon A07HR60]
MSSWLIQSFVNPDESDTHLPSLPRKLADRIDGRPDNLHDSEMIVGNGDVELRSNFPVSVVEYFLASHASQWSKATYRDYSYDLTRFLEYCEYANIDDLSTVSSANLTGFKQWRDRDENVALATLHGQLTNLRVFIRACESIEIVEEGLADEIAMPDLDDSDIVSSTRLESETAQQIQEYHAESESVSRQFAEFMLMWEGLVRLGGARSIDLEDYNREEQYIELTHEPDTDTPLKNGTSDMEGQGGERKLNLPADVCEVLNTYIDGTGDPNDPKRIENEDEHGREPLFTTRNGRVSNRRSDVTSTRSLSRVGTVRLAHTTRPTRV